MMCRLLTLCFLLVVWISVLPSLAGATTYYVDNTHTGSNAGTQANPFQSLADLWAENDVGANTIYIAGNGSANPYREALIDAMLVESTFYCDWDGTTATGRGTVKAHFWGSENLTSSSWSSEGGDVYSVSYDNAAGALEDLGSGDYGGVWWISGTDVTVLSGDGDTSPEANEWYYDSVGNTLYVNIGADPDGESFEIAKLVQVTEGRSTIVFDGSVVYNGIFRFGNYGCGKASGNTSGGWEFIACEFSYNALYGIRTQASQYVPSQFKRCAIFENGDGALLDGGSKECDFHACIIRDNDGFGVKYNTTAASTHDIFNCTILDNGGYGVTVVNGGGAVTMAVKNVLSQGNTSDEFHAEDHANITLSADYNRNTGTYGGKWAAGANDSSCAPNLNSSYTPINWACYVVGTSVPVTEDYLGNVLPRGGKHPIGAIFPKPNSFFFMELLED